MESTHDETETIITPRRNFQNLKRKKLRSVLRKKDKKIKLLHQNLRRKKKRIASLSEILKLCKNKSLLNEEDASSLELLSSTNSELFERQLLKAKGKRVPKKYGEDIKKFVLNLNFVSPKAYNFVRENFNS